MKKMIFLSGVSFVLFSCNADSSGTSSATKNDNSNSKDMTCALLEKYDEDYSGLLTKEEMASVYPIDFDKAEVELRNGSYGEYIFRWPSNRPAMQMEASGMKLDIPDQNAIGVSKFFFNSGDFELQSSIDHFEMGYKKLSDAELKQIEENLSKQKENVKSDAKNFMKVRDKMHWEFIEGLGSSAWYKWKDDFGGELSVMAGKARFTILIKISSDPNENKELAQKLAEKIIAKC